MAEVVNGWKSDYFYEWIHVSIRPVDTIRLKQM